jgi:hypothetical protein
MRAATTPRWITARSKTVASIGEIRHAIQRESLQEPNHDELRETGSLTSDLPLLRFDQAALCRPVRNQENRPGEPIFDQPPIDFPRQSQIENIFCDPRVGSTRQRQTSPSSSG